MGFGTFYSLVSSSPQVSDIGMGSLPDGAPHAEQLLGQFGGDGLIPLGAIPLVFAPKQDFIKKQDLVHFAHD